MLNKFLNWYRGQTNAVKAVSVFSITTLLIGIIFMFNIILMSCVTTRVMQPIFESDNKLIAGIDSMPRPLSMPAVYFNAFKRQASIMHVRKQHHWELAKLLFRNYYSILSLSIILSCIGGLTLFALINRGWATAGVTLQSFFLTLATALAFVGFFPLVFKQQENFAQNMLYYENYGKGEVDIFNQLTLLQDTTPIVLSDRHRSDSLWFRKLDSLVDRNNTLLWYYTNYVLSIDPDQVKSISDVLHILQNTVKSSSDSVKIK